MGWDKDRFGNEFCGSCGWIDNVMARNGIVGINLHGEASELDNDEQEKMMKEWKEKKFHPVIEKHNIPPGRVYNADQTGLYYAKMPNCLCGQVAKKRIC